MPRENAREGLSEEEVVAVALIAFRAIWARRRRPDAEFDAAWVKVREEEIFRMKITLLAIQAVVRDGLAAR
jgi:hypothetical protein